MKKLLFCALFLLMINATSFGQSQWSGPLTTTDDIYRIGEVGIGITSPSTYLEVKSKIDMGSTATNFISTYYIGSTNDYGAGGAAQYLLLTPFNTMSSGNPSAGLSGKLNFYRGNTGSSDFNAEYNVAIQTAYNQTIVNIAPATGIANVVPVYKVTYSGVIYVAINPNDVFASATSITFQGHYWNNVNTQKPTLVLASAVTSPTLLKDYAVISGNNLYEDITKNIGIGTNNPATKFEVQGGIRSSGVSSASGYFEATNIQNGNTYFLTNTVSGNGIIKLNKVDGTTAALFNSNGTSYFAGGNLLIGSTTPTNPAYLLDVNGPARVDKLTVNTTGADFVFENKYRLKSIAEVEKYINHYHHLPDVAPAAQMQSQGIDVAKNQTVLLQKIEELTLYVIQLKKEINLLKSKRK